MRITTLSPKHWQKYKELRLEAVRDNPQSFLATVEETEAMPNEEWQDKIKNMIFAVTVEDEVIGMIGGYAEPKEKLRHVMQIVSFYVQPEYRGQGIGRKLFQEVIKKATQDHKIKKLALGVITTQLPAQKLYESEGFKKVGEFKMAVKVGEEFFDEYLMEMVVEL